MAMTLRLSPEKTEALRQQAELEGRSMQDVAQRSIDEYLARHTRAVERRTLLEEAVHDQRQLLDRLRDT